MNKLIQNTIDPSHNIKGQISRFEIITKIDKMMAKVHQIYHNCVIRKQINEKYKLRISRINVEIQKLGILYKKLCHKKEKILEKTKKDNYEELLRVNKQLVNELRDQIEEIKKHSAYDEDKFEFVNKQVQIFNNNCFVPKTTLLLKKLEKEKENDHSKLLCREAMIDDILLSSIKYEKIKELTENRKQLITIQFENFVKDCKTTLNDVVLLKSVMLLRFDNDYNGKNKSEILKLIPSVFNALYAIGDHRLSACEVNAAKWDAAPGTTDRSRTSEKSRPSSGGTATSSAAAGDGENSERPSCVCARPPRAEDRSEKKNAEDCTDEEGFKPLQYR